MTATPLTDAEFENLTNVLNSRLQPDVSNTQTSNARRYQRASSMTVLVTGGAGYHALVDAGERVVVLDNLASGFDWAVAQGASVVIGDVGDQPRVAALIAEHRVDAIIHFAASVVVPDSVRDPLGYYRNNTVNSHALIESAVKGRVRHFIFSSTAAVYGNPDRMPVREDDATEPTSPYGSSKLMTEIMLRDAGSAHGLRHMILRYFNVAGADPLGRTGQSAPAGVMNIYRYFRGRHEVAEMPFDTENSTYRKRDVTIPAPAVQVRSLSIAAERLRCVRADVSGFGIEPGNANNVGPAEARGSI